MLKRRLVSTETIVAQVKTSIKKREVKEQLPSSQLSFFSSGSTLLNLAMTDNPFGGFIPGSVVNIVGDSSAGKSFLLWTVFAEALLAEELYGKYRFLYDEPERAFYFQAERLFGEKVKRIETEQVSYTIQDWQKNVLTAIHVGKPFIYGLDSFDSLTSKEEQVRMQSVLKEKPKKGSDEKEEDQKEKGSYKTEKPKIAGEILRSIVRELQNTKSLLVIVSQTRQKIGVTFGEKKTRSGGDALRFYSTHEVWLSVLNHIRRKDRDVGVEVLARIKKNKYTGKLRQVAFPIYFDYGVDDLGSCIDWLLEEKFWGKEKQTISTGGDFPNSSREKLIQYIEENSLENQLKKIVGECWKEVEQEIATVRKPKYQ